MADSEESELIQTIRAKRGYVLPLHRFLDKEDPDFLETYDRFFTLATDSHNDLSTEVRELVLLAIDLSLGVNPDVAATHAKRAIEAGASIKQALAVVELVALGEAAKGLNAGVAALIKGTEG
jgi:alkylhydroperoxidase/carboxymuconolactone decarboxylase family protein YurZ